MPGLTAFCCAATLRMCCTCCQSLDVWTHLGTRQRDAPQGLGHNKTSGSRGKGSYRRCSQACCSFVLFQLSKNIEATLHPCCADQQATNKQYPAVQRLLLRNHGQHPSSKKVTTTTQPLWQASIKSSFNVGSPLTKPLGFCCGLYRTSPTKAI